METPRRLKSYYNAKHPRIRVLTMLAEHGELNIQRILEKYNRTWSRGITMSELAAILSGDSRFEKTGEEKIRSIAGKLYTSTVWGAANLD